MAKIALILGWGQRIRTPTNGSRERHRKYSDFVFVGKNNPGVYINENTPGLRVALMF